MRLLVSLSTLGLVSALSLQARADGAPNCAHDLISGRTAGGRILAQRLRLAPAQARQIQLVRAQTQRRLQVLDRRLAHVRATIARVNWRVQPQTFRRLRQTQSALQRRVSRVRALGATRITALLTAQQRQRCELAQMGYDNDDDGAYGRTWRRPHYQR